MRVSELEENAKIGIFPIGYGSRWAIVLNSTILYFYEGKYCKNVTLRLVDDDVGEGRTIK